MKSENLPKLGLAYLLVTLERNITAHHVVEQDAEGPHRGRLAVVPALLYPLGRGVHSGTCTIEVLDV